MADQKEEKENSQTNKDTKAEEQEPKIPTEDVEQEAQVQAKDPASPVQPTTPPKQTVASSATVDRIRLRAREDTPVRLEPQSIGKPPRTPNFAMFKPKLGSASAQKFKMAMDLDEVGTPQKNGTPFKSASKGRYGQKIEKADFDVDIASKIGTIKWDSDEDD
ncbi:hypothetical protein H072_9671 [Dactylellina haptotyla CBS 200.50]|uniref:Uncharacterized protein n=1 Tax=Dactylellina haptotyla (strain CBS 200.50) TaxID=1284197 RepID=S8BCD2_DACHA|nr:hypothetical protein H072_9671 [Dactylellina haptotyla CBS 200.50]